MNIGFAGFIAALGLVAGKRSWCRLCCPISLHMRIGRLLGKKVRIPSLKISAHSDGCTNCSQCTEACSMSVDVHSYVKQGTIDDSECILCGECIDVCPQNVLFYNFNYMR